MQFLYFLPDKSGEKEARAYLSEIGLDMAIDMSTLTFAPIIKSPAGDDVSGAIITTGKQGTKPRIGYYPAEQTWGECEYGVDSEGNEIQGKYWIGYETLNPPTPDDLSRTEQVGGYYAKLRDGNNWIVPTARQFAGGTKLPESLCLGPNGEAVKEILPEFIAVSKMAEQIFNIVSDGNLEDEEPRDLICWACKALAVNYFVNEWSMSALRILTTANVQKVLFCIIDGPMWMAVLEDMEAEKKSTDSRSSNTTNGEQGNSAPTTTPQSAT